jgi:hypothetical protein
MVYDKRKALDMGETNLDRYAWTPESASSRFKEKHSELGK